MKQLLMTVWLLSALFVPCAFGQGTYGSSSSRPKGTKQELNISGNWQLSTESTEPHGIPSWTIAGSITQSGSSLKAVLHVDGSSCFQQPTPIALTGSITHGVVSLTSGVVDGQVIAISGRTGTGFGLHKLTGSYAVSGGCADGEQGNVTGYMVPSIAGYWAGDLTTATGGDIGLATQLIQGSASREGSFGLKGTANVGGTCFGDTSGKIKSGVFPTASFVMGTSVAMDIKTDNGTISFRGALDGDLIIGTYTITGGSCESTGTGYLSPWEY